MKLPLLTLAIVLGTSLTAQEKFSLSNAQEYALDHAYGVQIAELEIDRAKQIYRQNLAYGLPQASASGQYVYNIELGGFVADMNGDGVLEKLVFGTDYQAAANFTVNQLVFDGSYVVGLMAAKVLKDGAALKVEKTKSELLRDVSKAYHVALLSESGVQVLEKNVEYMKELAHEMKRLNQAGFVSKADADQMMLNFNNLNNALTYAKGQSEVAKMMLKLQMGFPVSKDLMLQDDLETLMVQAANSSALIDEKFDATNTVDYRSVENQVAGAQLQLKNQYMGLLPSLGVAYQNNVQIQSQEANIFATDAVNLPTSLVAARVSVPLFSSGNKAAKIQEAKIQRDQALIGLEQLEEGLLLQYAATVNEYHRALTDYLLQKENVELAKKIRDQRRREYEEGVGSSSDFTQSESQYQQALQNLFKAAQSALDQRAELEYLLSKQS
jgi:outer membrane protein TolC